MEAMAVTVLLKGDGRMRLQGEGLVAGSERAGAGDEGMGRRGGRFIRGEGESSVGEESHCRG